MSHVTPEEAVQIGIDIKSINILGGHWGTIELSDEDHWEPPKRFMSSGIKAGFDANNIWIMKIGEVKKLP
jgi:N-acyl-phosphatidylethanolamine-hydrolysing phospholipase D